MRCARRDPFDESHVEAVVRRTAAERAIKAGMLIHAARVAVTGRTSSPGLFEVIVLLGRDRTVARLERLVTFLATRPIRNLSSKQRHSRHDRASHRAACLCRPAVLRISLSSLLLRVTAVSRPEPWHLRCSLSYAGPGHGCGRNGGGGFPHSASLGAASCRTAAERNVDCGRR